MKYKINRFVDKTIIQHGVAHFGSSQSLNPAGLSRRQRQAAPFTSPHLSVFLLLSQASGPQPCLDMHSHRCEHWTSILARWRRSSSSIGKVTLSQLSLKIPSPAGVREQRVLAPLGHIAMVITVVHSLRGVVSGQVVRRGVLGRTGSAPLAQGLLGAVRAVDVVADHARLASLGHGHVQDPGVVLWGREVLGAARGRAHLMCAGL